LESSSLLTYLLTQHTTPNGASYIAIDIVYVLWSL
jgi:hypothetical protein